jgi:hypothetical protein
LTTIKVVTPQTLHRSERPMSNQTHIYRRISQAVLPREEHPASVEWTLKPVSTLLI